MRLFVKICGITNLEDGLAAAQAGADAIGLVFYPPSWRFLTPAEAARVSSGLGGRAKVVGVFVNPPLATVSDVAREAGLDYIQLHGDEPPDYCSLVKEVTGRGLIKALRIRSAEDMRRFASEWGERAGESRSLPDYFLLDTYVPGVPGGTGASFEWGLARAVSLPAPVIIAGGLDPENVVTALSQAIPAGVDVSSGVESGRRKDREKMRRFVAAVRRWESEGWGNEHQV